MEVNLCIDLVKKYNSFFFSTEEERNAGSLLKFDVGSWCGDGMPHSMFDPSLLSIDDPSNNACA